MNNQGVVPMQSGASNFQRMNNLINDKNSNQGHGQNYANNNVNNNQLYNNYYFPQNNSNNNYQQPQFNNQQQNQQQSYNQDMYQMKIQQAQRQQQQYNQTHNNQHQQLIQFQLNQLGGSFKIQQEYYQGYQPGINDTLIKLFVKLQNGLEIPIKIILSNQFPSTKPQFLVQKKLKHEIIDKTTWEICYGNIFQWNQGARLVDLANQILQKFQQQPPQQDPLQMEIENLKSKVSEDQQAIAMKQTQLNQLFQDLNKASQTSNHTEDIKKLKTYQVLQDFILELSSKLQSITDKLDKKSQELQEKRQYLQNIDEQFQTQKALHSKLHSDVELLKERFSSNTILQVLDYKLNDLQEKTLQQEELQLNGQNFQDFLRDYQYYKNQYYTLELKKAKFQEIV